MPSLCTKLNRPRVDILQKKSPKYSKSQRFCPDKFSLSLQNLDITLSYRGGGTGSGWGTVAPPKFLEIGKS